ncbi:hypothetical protein BV20DRAFT_962888 [Pilatotrama ljubarskyi]|nr:hypothetical protein BV20DRAFT_962888 [Pilatotrama ljubarskyi]
MGDRRKREVGDDFQWVYPETEQEWIQHEKGWEDAANTRDNNLKSRPIKSMRTSKYWPQPADEQPERSSPRPASLPTKADIIREKVERWQAEVATEPEDASASISAVDLSQLPKADKARAKTKEPLASGEKVQTSLSFRVVKRSSVTSAKGDRAVVPKPKATPPARPPSPPTRDHTSNAPGAVLSEPPNLSLGGELPEEHQNHDLPQIAEVPELSFLPPSFPSQLQTSTPPLNSRRQKPAPIAPCSPPPSSPQSPMSSKSFNPSRPQRRDSPQASSSAPAASPERRPLKRARTPNSPREDGMDVSQPSRPRAPLPKKARIEPFLEQEPISSGPQPVPPSTPPPATSPLNVPVTPVSRHKGLGNAKGLPVPTTPDPHPLPTLTELLASSRRSKPRPRPPSRKNTPYDKNNAAPKKDRNEQLEGETELPALTVDEREPSPTKTYFSSPASGSSDSASVLQRSPVSPLFTQNPGAFVPAFVSSQRPSANDDDPFLGGGSHRQSQAQGLIRGSSGVFGMGYNSQFDVEGQVDRVSELLERDVDYNGWLRDLDDDEEMPQAQSQGTVGVGY